jgi:hypothetical protein
MQRKKSYQAQNLLGKNFEKHHCSFSFYYSNTPQDIYRPVINHATKGARFRLNLRILVVNFLKNRKE